MISQTAITAWRNVAPWGSSDQVEHDLVLSRAICDLYKDPIVAKNLVFRGGTALHKLYFEQSGRFSEDLDFVQTEAAVIGPTANAVRNSLDHWLGTPSWKQNHGRFTLNYRFVTEEEPIVTRKVKIEINTREHFNIQPYVKKLYQVDSSWFRGESEVLTYSREELLATKLRALYQRNKGRDLYDFWYVAQSNKGINVDQIVTIFEQYMQHENIIVSRAEFEKNLFLKKENPVFTRDIMPLLAPREREQYSVDAACQFIAENLLVRLKGSAWKGMKK